VNRYKIKFNAICPVNGDAIEYSLTIESSKMIPAESIKEAVDECTNGFHEAFADELHSKFGGKQFISAVHGGVLIETERGI
jgi:hypothetical protein